MTEASSLAKIEGVGLLRDGRWLIRGVSLEVSAGEIVTLIGPNGSGKSTSAKVLLGLLSADEGGVWQKPKLRVGYVPQKLAIDWTLPLSVRRLMQLTSRLPESEIIDALTATEARHLIDQPVQQLSGGEFQRVLLARALARKPELLVLDEPVQGVDFAGQVSLYKLISSIRDRTGCGILMISHDLHVVMAATDRVVCLNGHVCCTGTPQSVAADPSYLSLFGHSGAEALAVYQHHHDHVHLPDGSVAETESGTAQTQEKPDHAG